MNQICVNVDTCMYDYVLCNSCIYCSYYISDRYVTVATVLAEANECRHECTGNPVFSLYQTIFLSLFLSLSLSLTLYIHIQNLVFDMFLHGKNSLIAISCCKIIFYHFSVCFIFKNFIDMYFLCICLHISMKRNRKVHYFSN